MKTKLSLIAFLLSPVFVMAQDGTPPSAGLTPQSPLYFLDRLEEFFQELIAFNPETKIRLQVGFAAERIAEIQLQMEEKDVDAKGLSIAQSRLEKHLTEASNLVSEEEGKGKDMKKWTEILNNEFEVSKQVLESSFESAKDDLEDEREEIKKELETAKKNGDAGLIENLKGRLEDIEDEKDELELQREMQKKSLERERENLRDEDDMREELEDIEKDLEEEFED